MRFYPRESLKYVEILRSGRRLGDGEITFYKDMFFPIPSLLGKKTSVFSHGLFFPCLKYPRCSCAQGPFLLFCQFSLGDSVLFSGLSNCLNAHDPHVSLECQICMSNCLLDRSLFVYPTGTLPPQPVLSRSHYMSSHVGVLCSCFNKGHCFPLNC